MHLAHQLFAAAQESWIAVKSDCEARGESPCRAVDEALSRSREGATTSLVQALTYPLQPSFPRPDKWSEFGPRPEQDFVAIASANSQEASAATLLDMISKCRERRSSCLRAIEQVAYAHAYEPSWLSPEGIGGSSLNAKLAQQIRVLHPATLLLELTGLTKHAGSDSDFEMEASELAAILFAEKVGRFAPDVVLASQYAGIACKSGRVRACPLVLASVAGDASAAYRKPGDSNEVPPSSGGLSETQRSKARRWHPARGVYLNAGIGGSAEIAGDRELAGTWSLGVQVAFDPSFVRLGVVPEMGENPDATFRGTYGRRLGRHNALVGVAMAYGEPPDLGGFVGYEFVLFNGGVGMHGQAALGVEVHPWFASERPAALGIYIRASLGL
ncbi:MAG: hypothetical protein GY811_01105 [Myxococcales bacterium]|nr:hypothetical protein [Myxococcales bacterium]